MKIKLNKSEIKKLKANRGGRPHRVKFQLTNACNARCKHCNLYLIKPNFLETEVVKKTLLCLSSIGCREVDFTGGEPTLHPDLISLMKLANKLGLKVKVNSNGYLIGQKLADEMVRIGLRELAISIDSHDPSLHNKRRRLNDSWQKAIAAIQNVDKARAKYKTKTKITLYSIITNKNYKDAPKVLDLKKIANFDKINFIPIKNQENKKDFLSSEQINDFYRNVKPVLLKKYQRYRLTGIFRTVKDPFEILNSKTAENALIGLYTKEIFKTTPCYIANFYAYIISDGSVVPCCVAPHHLNPKYIMGNVYQNTFEEIWNSARYHHLRKILLRPCFKICQCCSGHHTAFNLDIHRQIISYETNS